jgi:hypothetical protein
MLNVIRVEDLKRFLSERPRFENGVTKIAAKWPDLATRAVVGCTTCMYCCISFIFLILPACLL